MPLGGKLRLQQARIHAFAQGNRSGRFQLTVSARRQLRACDMLPVGNVHSLV